jgi:hypothetical protein
MCALQPKCLLRNVPTPLTPEPEMLNDGHRGALNVSMDDSGGSQPVTLPSESFLTFWVIVGGIYLFHSLGEWLLDARLLNKRLDVCIQGTKRTLYRNGRYKDACGFLVLEQTPSDVSTSIIVKIGFAEGRLHFPVWHIFPLTTMERPQPSQIRPNDVKPIISSPRKWVVIIGLDLDGKADFIGCCGLIAECDLELGRGQAYIYIIVPGSIDGQYGYFYESSLCQSTAGTIEWFGRTVQ